jgi:hypothetical protein
MRAALLILLGACAAIPRADPEDPLAVLNRQARAAYAEARTRALANAGPVLIVGPARITLLHGDVRREFELQAPIYHDLKTIAHLALGLHALHYQAQVEPGRLQTLREAAPPALAALAARGLSAAQLERQREIVRLSLP